MAFHPPQDERTLVEMAKTGDGNVYVIPVHPRRAFLVGSDITLDWEHVLVTAIDPRDGSVSMATWDEMCLVKEIFWDKEDMVMQLHPPQSEYVNDNPYTLHLWRPVKEVIPNPFLGMLKRWEEASKDNPPPEDNQKGVFMVRASVNP